MESKARTSAALLHAARSANLDFQISLYIFVALLQLLMGTVGRSSSQMRLTQDRLVQASR